MWQQAIDVVGKLGPLFVALAVFAANRNQTRWTNALAVRAAAVEDQKFRLALLDRRATVIEKITRTIGQCWLQGAVDKEAVNLVVEALRQAELVFDDEQCTEIRNLVSQLWIWRSINRKVESYRGPEGVDDPDALQRAIEDLGRFEDGLTASFEPLIASLKKASRVSTIPTVTSPEA